MKIVMSYKKFLILFGFVTLSGCISNPVVPDRPISMGDQIKLTPLEARNRNAEELNNTIAEIQSMHLVKDNFEKSDEFLERIRLLYDKYNGRRYEFSVSCDYVSGKYERTKLVTYDVESESVRVSLPDMEIESVWLEKEKTFRYMYYSFLPTQKANRITDTYSGSNSFGKKVEVLDVEESFIGVALLTSGTKLFKNNTEFWNTSAYMKSLPKPIEARERLARDEARSGLNDCKVVFEVEAAFNDVYPYHQYPFIHAQRSSMLFTENDETKPTISDPYHTVRNQSAMPVKLLSINISAASDRVFRTNPTVSHGLPCHPEQPTAFEHTS